MTLRHVDAALQYARDVISGEIPACKWVQAACQRQLDDLARWESDPEYPFEWRPDLGERVCRFIERLRHVKGKWAGTLIRLEPFQSFALVCVFGWVRRDTGARRFRTVYQEVPRKNAKTTLLAGVGLYMLVADDEWGAEVYSAATTRDQAAIVFDIASQMARMDGEFRATFRVEALTRSLSVRDTASKFLPLAAEGAFLDGLNVSCALIDELHAHKDRSLHDVLDSGTGARGQPLLWKITTAGSNRAGVCYDQRTYLTKVLNAVLRRHDGMGYRVDGTAVDDDSFWGIIYTIDDDDDPMAESTWRKANPNYGVSVDVEDLRRMALQAQAQQAALAGFLTKRLNVWINADSAWMNMLRWDACGDRTLREADFANLPCVVALDAAFKKDLFAKVKLFDVDDRLHVFARFYAPRALVEREGNEQLLAWANEGWIVTTPGEVLDIGAVRDDLLGTDDGTALGDTRLHEVTACAFDPFQLTQFAGELLEEGVPMVDVRATVANFSPAMKEVEELVEARRLVHQANPVLDWMIANVVCHTDRKDNVYPNKANAADKIDGAVALIMAVNRWMAGSLEGEDAQGFADNPVIAT